jgi:aspartyl-tRNA synthetase
MLRLKLKKNGEITGISFQKVDDHEGIVQAIFDSNNFSQVNWENAPTIDRTVKSVWLRQVFGLLRVRFRQVSL